MIDIHFELDKKNRRLLKEKKLLKLIYSGYFQIIKKNLSIKKKSKTLEIGSSGFIKKTIPYCITSNLQKEKNDKMIDICENVYNLKQKRNFLSNIIMVDIFHHLKFPGLALNNMHRVLRKGGRIVMIEPAMGIIPRIIYKLFHHEPNGFDIKIKWNNVPKKIPKKNSYFAAQSVTWRAFYNKELDLRFKFRVKKVECFSDFAYLGSGGFSYKSLYPLRIFYYIKFIDKILTKISSNFFAARMLVVLEKI